MPTSPDHPTSNDFDRRSFSARGFSESLVFLLLGVLLVRQFGAEAYIVPSGSMAPTLLGMHREVTCPRCRFQFPMGLDEGGNSNRPICPNCGRTELDGASVVERNGDRLLVQRSSFEWRTPRRWEVIVFRNPAEPSQAYVKRLVGLPGESIQIEGGDVYVNGRIARKTLAEQRGMRILVHDNNFLPDDPNRPPRWMSLDPASGWSPQGTRFVHEPKSPAKAMDWLEYHHWEPDRGAFGPVFDFTPYNGEAVGSENRVEDLTIEAKVVVQPGSLVAVRIGGGPSPFVIRLPTEGRGLPEVTRGGRVVPISGVGTRLSSSRPVRLEASWFDHRLIVALDGVRLFDPIDVTPPAEKAWSSLPALGIAGVGGMEVGDLRVYRDVYYTGALAGNPRRPFGVESSYPLGMGEFFVLGDNSPVSNDSRFWPESPVVRADLLLGKPFLVHLPSRGLPLKVFGGETYWVPDPREIRYIR